MPNKPITKMDAAKRQLDSAVELFLKDFDPISIHTLVAASHGILSDIGRKQGIKSILKGHALSLIKEDKKAEYIKKTNEAQNFFKHAGSDAKATLGFNADQSTLLLFDACEMYLAINKSVSALMFLFRVWFMMNYPDVIADKSIKDQFIQQMNTFNIDPKNRSLFLDILPKIPNPFPI